MRIIKLIVLWNFLIGLTACQTASFPKQYVYREEPTPVESTIKESVGGHGIDLIRSASNAFETHLILVSEGIYLNREEIEKKQKKRHFLEKLTPSEGELPWWTDQFDGVKIPGAITGEAIRYYIHIIRSMQKGDYSVCDGYRHKRSHFDYKAEVHYHPKFQYKDRAFRNVYTVQMKLSISTYMGDMAAMYFTKERVVVFSKGGSVLAVLGDDEGSMIVS